MFMLSKKLKTLKPIIRRLGRDHIGHIHNRTRQAHLDLCEAQEENLHRPTTTNMDLELAAYTKWEVLSGIEEGFLRQKSKIHWLKVGDKNNGYFHMAAKTREHRNAIREIKDHQGNVLTLQEDVKREAVRFFEEFLNTTSADLNIPSEEDISNLLRFKCSPIEQEGLLCNVSDEEIKLTLFKMPRNKSPGPDGFTSEFYIAAWSVVGSDFTAAVQSFFKLGFLPKGVNSTILALVPKRDVVSEMKDFRPISCCNVLYKVISKILTKRLKRILPSVICRNQSAFVEGRLLLENVLLATELVKDYHKPSISRRGAAKIDIAKAFDTVQWPFLHATLLAMGIPGQFIKWIMLCITTASFSVQVNGELAGYFNSKRGLRQGCALSPYLFVICMNVLSKMLDVAALAGQIGYHPKCRSLFLTHLCFADDLLVFSDGTLTSLKGIIEVFDKFASNSGLEISLVKSTLYIAGLSTNEKSEIFANFPFKEGTLPVKYLGLPSHTKKLSMADCLPLITWIKERITSWTARFLSYAGRLQLINSVLLGITNFWLSAFCLPKKCLHEINSICSSFLWSGPELNTRKIKVSWIDVCTPKKEGGLGIRSLLETSKVSYLKLVWRIISRQSSLWVTWVWDRLIKGGSFWSIKESTSIGSWIWRKILQQRMEAKKLYKMAIGNGKKISFWYDIWTALGCLYDLFGDRGVIDLGIPRTSTLFEAVNTHQSRRHRNALMQQVVDQLQLIRADQSRHGEEDQVLWLSSGTQYLNDFSSKLTWMHTREQRLTKVWYKLIWFNHATPKFSFVTWLAFQDRLSTRDRTKLWNNGGDAHCLLCGADDETRKHIFFDCIYSRTTWWSIMGQLLGPDHTSDWDLLTNVLLQHQGSKVKFFIVRYAFQATIYHIWRERNNRNHRHKHLHSRLLARIIDKTIRNNLSAIRSLGDTSYETTMGLWFSSRV